MTPQRCQWLDLFGQCVYEASAQRGDTVFLCQRHALEARHMTMAQIEPCLHPKFQWTNR